MFRRCAKGLFAIAGLASIALALPLDAQTAPQPIVLQDVRLIDGTGQPPRDHVQITITGDRITEIRSALLRIAFPPNARVLNLSGKTVIPGLINGHGHLGLTKGLTVAPANYTPENIESQLKQYERYGVTTMMSLGMNKDLLYGLIAAQKQGQFGGATIHTADRGLGSPDGMPPVAVGTDQVYRPGTPAEARQDVDEMAARHPDLIKIWIDDNLGKLPKQKPDVYAAAIDETHKHHLRIAAHLFYQADARRLLEDHVDILAHSIRDEPITDDTVAAIKSQHVYYIPTLALEDSFFIYAEHPAWMDTPFFQSSLNPELAAALKSPAYAAKINSDPTTALHKQALKVAMQNLKKLYDAGAPIAFGGDSGANPFRIQGFAEHRELELMVVAGMTPVQALHSATGVNAAMLHIDGQTGTVEKGKQADLIVLDADPSEDIRNTRKIDMIFHQGKQVH